MYIYVFFNKYMRLNLVYFFSYFCVVISCAQSNRFYLTVLLKKNKMQTNQAKRIKCKQIKHIIFRNSQKCKEVYIKLDVLLKAVCNSNKCRSWFEFYLKYMNLCEQFRFLAYFFKDCDWKKLRFSICCYDCLHVPSCV